jgi:type II secretory pathway pseudopilin PulG
MTKPHWLEKGFTITEVFIVVGLMAILVGIAAAGYKGYTSRSRASAFVTELKNVKEAFELYAQKTGVDNWWKDNEFTYSNDPLISTIITNTDFKNYLPKVPTIVGMPGLVWKYDNDLNTFNPSSCGNSTYDKGVNIIVSNLEPSIAKRADEVIDDGNFDCGYFRYKQSTKILYYHLSKDSTMQ